MADNFDMKKFLVENKLGAYSKLKNEGEAAYEYEKGKAAGEKLAKEDLGKDLEDTEAAKQMDFLAEEDPLNEDASQTVIELLGMLAGLAGMGLSGVQILKWQDKLEKENPELHRQLGKVSGAIGAADPSKNLEENEDAGGIENDIEQDLMYTEDPILYLKSIIDFCNKKIEEIGQDTDGIEEAKKKIKEALTPEMFERMDAVTSTRAQLAMIKAAEIMMNELTEEGFEVLDIREYFTQLIANDI
jgi:hypothetical protein